MQRQVRLRHVHAREGRAQAALLRRVTHGVSCFDVVVMMFCFKNKAKNNISLVPSTGTLVFYCNFAAFWHGEVLLQENRKCNCNTILQYGDFNHSNHSIHLNFPSLLASYFFLNIFEKEMGKRKRINIIDNFGDRFVFNFDMAKCGCAMPRSSVGGNSLQSLFLATRKLVNYTLISFILCFISGISPIEFITW